MPNLTIGYNIGNEKEVPHIKHISQALMVMTRTQRNSVRELSGQVIQSTILGYERRVQVGNPNQDLEKAVGIVALGLRNGGRLEL